VKPLTFLSLFSGIGGLDLGLERAGMRCVGQVEIDPYCRHVLAKHWPDVPRFEDVRTFDGQQFSAVSVVAGGFPCKQTSTGAAISGRRTGLRGNDSGLWFQMLRIIGEARPEWAVVENVSGAGTWSAEIESGLAGIGYAVRIIRGTSAAFGAPHLRRRVLFVANADISRLSFAGEAWTFPAECFAWRASERNPWVSSLPSVLRVADGVPGGLDRRQRIVALGNAVDPNLGEWIGRRIVAASPLTGAATAAEGGGAA
jgi:DNA (cytosine-5)-methyltransferase 1